jgi:hypothetical protein
MGFFDRLAGRNTPPRPAAPPSSGATTEVPTPATSASGGVIPRLAAARQKLEAKDLNGALEIYDEVLALAGDRADVLVTISGDLGSNGHVTQIVELIAPRYDAQRHGPATGLNLLQAYLAMRNPGAAQHVLDILFALNRPELEERLYGFSNAIADMMAIPSAPPETVGGEIPAEAPRVALISLGKPIWYYGLETFAPPLLPAKESRPRRIAFTQLAVPGYPQIEAAMKKPEDELGRLSRAIPLWLAEPFHFSPQYAAIAAVGLLDDPATGKHPALFPAEWTTDNLRQLVDTSDEGLDYVFTGALRHVAGDYDLLLRVFEVKKFRERKTFTARWTPANADAELSRLGEQIRTFMEWKRADDGYAYVPPTRIRAWLETLGASLGLFLVEKDLLPREHTPSVPDDLQRAGAEAGANELASLAFLTLRARATKLGLPAGDDAPLAASPAVEQARQVLG